MAADKGLRLKTAGGSPVDPAPVDPAEAGKKMLPAGGKAPIRFCGKARGLRLEVERMTRKTRSIAPLLCLVVACAIVLAVGGCAEEIPPVPVNPFKERTSERNVLDNLEWAWKLKRIDVYCEMLADDFQFYFDEETRKNKGLPVYWTRLEDSTGTAHVFRSPYTRRIDISLQGKDGPVPVNEVGRETWTKVDVRNTFLEVEIDANPEQPEGLTMRVISSLQHFYFRKGRNAADTDTANSETAKLYYIVEWQDTGIPPE